MKSVNQSFVTTFNTLVTAIQLMKTHNAAAVQAKAETEAKEDEIHRATVKLEKDDDLTETVRESIVRRIETLGKRVEELKNLEASSLVAAAKARQAAKTAHLNFMDEASFRVISVGKNGKEQIIVQVPVALENLQCLDFNPVDGNDTVRVQMTSVTRHLKDRKGAAITRALDGFDWGYPNPYKKS